MNLVYLGGKMVKWQYQQHVNDILVASNSSHKLEEMRAFEMKLLGEPRSFLAMNIERDREEKYIIINQVLHRKIFGEF